jgi:hypothetical protein
MADEQSRSEQDLRMLFVEYHKRLMQEYDLGWQQLKISISIAGVFFRCAIINLSA